MTSATAVPLLRLSLAPDQAEKTPMDECPSCDARLLGEPQWCPRCLTRLDRAPARTAAFGRGTAVGLAPVVAPAPPARSTEPGLTTPVRASEPAPAAAAPIRSTVVRAIVLGFVLQIVILAGARGLHMEPARAVTWAVVAILVFYGVVLGMVGNRVSEHGIRPLWTIGPPGTGLVIGVGAGVVAAGLVVAVSSGIAGHVVGDPSATIVAAQQ